MRTSEFAVALALFAPVTLGAPATQSLERLSWLQGTWSGAGSGLHVESTYSAPKAAITLGFGRYTAGDNLAFFEFETFKLENGVVTLTPMPDGVPGVSFRATLLEDGHAVFENSSNDFPRLIEYKRLPDGDLYSRAEGAEGGQPVVYEFVQRRVN